MRWNGGILDVGIFCVVDGGWVGGWESVKRQLTHSLTHSLQSVQPILKVFCICVLAVCILQCY